MDFVERFFFIFFARITDVSLGTLRILFITKGQRYYAALIGFIEVAIYIIALKRVIGCLDNLVYVIPYAGGFAAGSILGSFIEEKMAFGYLTAQIIPNNGWEKLLKNLRSAGFGVTTLNGQGLTGPKVILEVSLERKKLDLFNELIEKNDHSAFVTIFETKKIKGGYFLKRK